MTPEERARNLVTKHALCRWCGSHDASGRDFPAHCQTAAAITAEIRAACEQAERETWEAAARHAEACLRENGRTTSVGLALGELFRQQAAKQKEAGK